MGRTPTGKPLTLKPIRVDEDVWAALQVLMQEHKTLNEGLRVVLFREGAPAATAVVGEVKPEPEVVSVRTVEKAPVTPRERYARGMRPKGDKTR